MSTIRQRRRARRFRLWRADLAVIALGAMALYAIVLALKGAAP